MGALQGFESRGTVSSPGEALIDSGTVSTSTILITAIPAIYRDLVIIVYGRSTASVDGDGLWMRVGSGSIDTGANYSYVLAVRGDAGNVTGGSDQTQINDNSGGAPWTGATATASKEGILRIELLRYSTDDADKHIVFTGGRRAGSTNRRFLDGWAEWASTSVIERVQIGAAQAGSNNFSTAEYFLYGR